MNNTDTFLVKRCPICKSNKMEHRKYSNIVDPYGCINGSFFFNKCLECDNLYLGNPLKKNLISKAYSHNYGAYSKMKFNNIRTLYIKYQAKKLLKPFKDKRLNILEIGAGEGLFSRYFKKKGHTVTAIDLDTGSMNRLRKQGIMTLIGSFEKINLKEKFDIIILSHVIEHFYNPHAIVKKLKKCLSHNGVIFIKTPSADFLLLNAVKYHTSILDTPRHINVFSKKSLRILFEKEKLSIVIIEEFTLNDFVNFFKMKFNKRIKTSYIPILAIIFLPLAIVSYILRRSSRIIAIVK